MLVQQHWSQCKLIPAFVPTGGSCSLVDNHIGMFFPLWAHWHLLLCRCQKQRQHCHCVGKDFVLLTAMLLWNIQFKILVATMTWWAACGIFWIQHNHDANTTKPEHNKEHLCYNHVCCCQFVSVLSSLGGLKGSAIMSDSPKHFLHFDSLTLEATKANTGDKQRNCSTMHVQSFWGEESLKDFCQEGEKCTLHSWNSDTVWNNVLFDVCCCFCPQPCACSTLLTSQLGCLRHKNETVAHITVSAHCALCMMQLAQLSVNVCCSEKNNDSWIEDFMKWSHHNQIVAKATGAAEHWNTSHRGHIALR